MLSVPLWLADFCHSSSRSTSVGFSCSQGVCARLPLVATYCCGLTREGAPVTFCLSVCVLIVSIQMTSLAYFVSNNQLVCFPVTLPMQAKCVLMGILSPCFLFPFEVMFQHCHYPSVTFLLPVFFCPVTISFFMFFCPSDLTFLSLKPSL